jgi:outer membrane protein, heavy metal efflux system
VDITRNERLQDAAQAQVFNDVDSAYATVEQQLTLLRRTRRITSRRLPGAGHDSFSYQRGGASLLDFLQAQQDYRSIQLSYLNLIGSYLTAAGAVESGRGTRGHRSMNRNHCGASILCCCRLALLWRLRARK